ncbi:glycoside hydrolase family 26 protein [Streptomyces sp. VRA16 Mangrove soil]|uniref:glycoside hydrolase family 26 protein n=1 Tax=Streptomyces sp. VRA16 Mangrove soil TaxID=2817434 RepID=UPI001A9D0E4F|nr:glycosyl hydrolase [Streptomyces sp. VRA16 Mangrove soil]MBO1335041.1 beta-mannanase [Streptomyces sp. VRA16 Mangrove soil]
MRTAIRMLLAVALLAVVSACSTFSDTGRDEYARNQGRTPGASASASADDAEPEPPYDVRPLLHPKKKYLGVAADGAPARMGAIESFAKAAGKKPNLVEFYSAWGDRYETRLVQNAWDYGALAYIAWEPFKASLKDIAAGKEDAYLRDYAGSVKELNLPVALSFAHEMNGHWYPWGTKKATAKQFVAAWRHVHDVFADVGATQVIWVWSPNVVNPMPQVKLAPYWPGDSYVDWVGVIGYYGKAGPATFQTLYGPTVSQVRALTKRPFLIGETAAEAGQRKPADIRDLFKGVAARDDFLGFVWFNFDKESDWRITSGPLAQRTFKERAADDRFGFDVVKP